MKDNLAIHKYLFYVGMFIVFYMGINAIIKDDLVMFLRAVVIYLGLVVVGRQLIKKLEE